MDLSLTDEQRLVVGNVRRFIRDEIVPRERDLDPEASELPDDDYSRLRRLVEEMGLFGFDVPHDLGGPNLDVVTRALIGEEISQHRAGLYAPAYRTFGSGGGLIQLYAGTEQQREKYLYPLLRGEVRGCFALTEPTGGSDPARAIRTTAKRDGDDWIINGSKVFISGADVADFALVFARTDATAGRSGITCFIVDTTTPGFTVQRIIHTLRSAHYPCELNFTEMRVPGDSVLGELGGGFKLANEVLTKNRVLYASSCIGVAVAAQRMAIDWVKVREVFGKKLAAHQAIQWMIVDSELEIRTGRWLYVDAASRADRSQPFRFEAAMAKMHCTEGAGRVVDRSMQIHGGYGVSQDLPLERWWRELRIRRIGEGPSEVQRHIMARDLLGGDFD